MKKYKMICQFCGTIFDSNNKKAKFCSDSCVGKNAARKRLLIQKEKNKEKFKKISEIRIEKIANEKKWLGKTSTGILYTSELDVCFGQKVECEFCHQQFYVSQAEFDRHKEKWFCSHKCFCDSKVEWIETVCLNCGNVYQKNIKDTFSQFCSDTCEIEFNDKIKNNHLPVKINFMQSDCINCHKLYWNITNDSVMYCSLKCKNEFEMKRNTKEKICEECGNLFFTHHNGRFCSSECASKNMIRKNKMWEHRAEKNGMANKNKSNAFKKRQERINNHDINECDVQHIDFCFQIKGYFSNIPHYIRSLWEANFALILMYLKREYKYEAKTINLDDKHQYIIDFYDVKRNIFYEIKGRYKNDSEWKIYKCMKLFSKIKIHIIDEKKYIRICKFFEKKTKLIINFRDYSKNEENTCNIIKNQDFYKMLITKNQHWEIYGDNEHNPYKIWKDEYDKKLGL